MSGGTAAAPVALVTGASRGIGRAVAVALARRGTYVVLTARSIGGLEETDDMVQAAGGRASLLPLDLMEGAEIDMLGPTLHTRFGRLDGMVHAAAVLGTLTPVGHITPKDWTEAVAVNLSATWRLVRTLDPLLRAAEAGRAAVLTDGRAQEPRAYWGTYGATKAASEHLVRTWAEESRNTSLRINLFDPGPVRSRLRATAMPGEDPATLTRPEDVAEAIADLLEPAEDRVGTTIRHIP